MLRTFVLKRKTVQLKKDVSVQQPNASEYTQTIIGWKLTKFTVLQQKNINVLYSLHYSLWVEVELDKWVLPLRYNEALARD